MNILIVYAHPESTSFTAALKDTALRTISVHQDLPALAWNAFKLPHARLVQSP
jgi:putative NADPH-quinone reductase